tara:strand:- start:31 stop:657 length:627 start_codon:yes stop_codon:yes gene_type:complete
MERRKKLRIIQISLLALGLLIFFTTYFNDNKSSPKKVIISQNLKNKIEEDAQKNLDKEENVNAFYNIQYSGLDISGNRYVLKSKEARTTESRNELINMIGVDAIFYFKDDTILYVKSNNALYNNITLDTKFFNGVEATYEESELSAKEAEYSNSKNFITITNNVKINDPKGNLYADKLFFDIKNKNLSITSFKNSKINANIDLNEKRF